MSEFFLIFNDKFPYFELKKTKTLWRFPAYKQSLQWSIFVKGLSRDVKGCQGVSRDVKGCQGVSRNVAYIISNSNKCIVFIKG